MARRDPRESPRQVLNLNAVVHLRGGRVRQACAVGSRGLNMLIHYDPLFRLIVAVQLLAMGGVRAYFGSR